ncbi:hypothetical protein EI94DRAFT_1805265 [Lactarius quietus]|nr:hypothetical protein EI94DRAFT_1805265 [Lactarius quietus]
MFQGSRTQTTEVKPDVGANTNDINVKVISAAGEEIHFKTKRTTKISKLQDAFANKVGRKVGGIRCVLLRLFDLDDTEHPSRV